MATGDTSIFSWTYRDRKRLQDAGGQKAQILQRYYAFENMYHSDFEGADLAITEAVQAAQAESETAWELFLRHWRVQLRLKEDLRRALPEAIDLLTLAEDQRVRDVPQRICAFHDVVYCHLAMDPVCYAEDTLENSKAVLAQTPARYDCADCARMNSASALAALGQKEEALAALARFHANQNGHDSSWLIGEAYVYLLLEQWEDVERVARQAIKRTREIQVEDNYTQAHIYLAQALIERGQLDEAGDALMECRRMTKYAGGSYMLAQLLEMDGRLHIAMGESGVDYLTRAAERYFALGRYREAAVAGLLAAERARDYAPPRGESAAEGEAEVAPAERLDPEPALAIAAQALGAVRAPDPKLAARLTAFGRVPVAPATRDESYAAPVSGGVREGLEAELEAHLANGNPRGVATALYRLGAWLTQHEQPRAAVDYLILNGVLERALRLTHSDREDALLMLSKAGESLPQGVIEAAFAAMERSVPERFAAIFGGIKPGRWRWLVRAVASEWRGEAVVEPEGYYQQEQDQEEAFMSWLDHNASMTTLVLRFRDRADPAGVERWTQTLNEIVTTIEAQSGGGPNPLVSFIRALAALCAGAGPERALALAQPPFVDAVRQVIELSGHPVWQHPGNSPFDYFIEQDAQKAVLALRTHDEHSVSRRENLAFRFELQAMDLREQESLADAARFLTALAATVRADGVVPASASELPEQFQKILAAVSAAGGLTP